MSCAQCQGIEEVFSQEYVSRELARYRRKGAGRTTRMLSAALQAAGVAGLTLLDIGGGVGALQHALLAAGAAQAVDVEASQAYLAAAREEAQRQGLAGRVRLVHGNFIDLAAEIAPADIVTLDRVICCYPKLGDLVSLSAERARKLYGLVYPRDTWWIKLGIAFSNFLLRLQHNPYRAFIHPTRAVEDILARSGLKRRFYRRTLFWQVVVYAR